MDDALAILRASLKDLWGDLWTTAVCNMLWLLCMLLVIPGPPATLALFYYGNRLAHGEVADVSDFFHAFRRHWGLAWRWGLINLGLVAILWGDYVLTGQLSQTGLARFVQSFYLALLWAWFLLQLFTLPFLFEQKTNSLRLALRNGAVMMGKNFTFTMAFGLVISAALVAGTLLFLISVAAGGAFVAVAGNRAVLNRLEVEQLAVEN